MLRFRKLVFVGLLTLGVCALATPAAAQVEPCAEPVKPPPADSPVLLRCIQLVFHPENVSMIEAQTYAHHLRSRGSESGKDFWSPYNEQTVQADFWNLWRTNFLDDLWIEVRDQPYENGVAAKQVIFHMEERPRIKIVDYVTPQEKGRLKVDVSKIEETLRERQIEVRLDSFVDQATIRRVVGVIHDLYSEKGYNYVKVEPAMKALAGGPKLTHLTFVIDEGPKTRISEVVFDGNTAFSDGKLRGELKENKPKSWLSFITSAGTYQEAKFPDDAEKLRDFYMNKGYALAQIGQPQIEIVRDSRDGKTRWIRLRIPVDEGQRYRIGKFDIAGNTSIKTEFLRPLFKVKEGDYFSRKRVEKGFEKVRELYGRVGFYQLTYDLERCPRGLNCETGEPLGPEPPPPILDVTARLEEGKQFFVNRITFLGNTTTHDNVIRREMRVYEGDVFNTEALKESLRRLNQLGYFKPLEGKDGEIDVKPTPGADNKVDVALKFEEQNRNQLSFGAGVSQFDGFFGQLSFQTSNFLGRGETVGVSLQRGSQARQYQVSFSEPYLFDRPITVGVDLFSRQFIFPFQYTQEATGGNLLLGLPVADYTRLFTGYSYQRIKIFDIDPSYLLIEALSASPYLRDSLLLDSGGKRTISKISPSLVFNTVSHPIFPNAGTRYTAAFDIAGIGGNTSYVQSRFEGIWYIPFSPRTSAGIRVESQYVRPYGQTTTLPIFEKFFMGGEYSIRGYDIRSVGPRDPVSGVVTGGNKTVLFNAEYYINIGGPVRVLAFYDAGQVRDIGQRFSMNQFRTSTGLELRFFMPVLNVPFRLIAAYNPQRQGVFTNNLLPAPKFSFRFAVGTTF